MTIFSKTQIEEGDDEIKIEDLGIGDRIQVISLKDGSTLDASEVRRMRAHNPLRRSNILAQVR